MKVLVFPFMLWPFLSVAGGLTEEVLITPDNSAEYGFEIEDEGPDPVYDAFTLRFPAVMPGGCSAGRVQTYAFDDEGQQLTGASLDYDLEAGRAEMILYERSDGYELGVTVQYCCEGDSPRGCQQAYRIDRINEFSSRE